MFQSFELESRWVARALSGRAELPGEEAMAATVEEDYRRMDAAGKPKRHTHALMPDWVRIRTKLRMHMILCLGL